MVVSEADEANREGNWSTKRDGSVSQEEADAASACHSFWEEVGRGAGANGSRFSAGLVQQTGVEHFPQPDLQHAQLGLCDAVVAPPERADTEATPCHTRRNPSIKTSAAFAKRDVMAFVWSVRVAVPYAICQIGRRVEIMNPMALPARFAAPGSRQNSVLQLAACQH